ncbi:calcium-binding protein [Chroococcus sp. FPU101]|uniref:calcium-binding protein n=1 Tax=Chroococcus sp. FPU101 TaxID=1974212 RepID=UPI001A8FC385|nr:calcium-binding protein [Chroococcus sp. FPU101]GFE71085.1 hypothetical protein CFPU101_36950 [Chroococcus sp. FPU101]
MANIYGNSGNNNLTGTSANDFIYGYDGLDTLIGLGGNDRLEGGNGNDTLDGGTGADTMIGGSGDDTYIVDSLSDVITELAGGGVDTIKTSLSYTLSENYVNNLTLTGSSNLNGTGNSYDNVITGNAGNNTLRGNAGKDTLNGGNGIDTLIGGTGDDTYIVDSTTDVITELPGQGVDTVISSVSYTLAENYVNNLTLTGTANLNGTGNSYDNVITGNEGNNRLKGGDGNDSLFSEFGNDTLYGEKGNDVLSHSSGDSTLYGGDGNDTLSGEFGSGYGDAGNDTVGVTIGSAYGGSGNDTVGVTIGSAYGGSGNDTVSIVEGSAYGDSGDDTLTGGFGTSLIGGLGNDILYCSYSEYGNSIVFNTSNEGTDTIIYFNNSSNSISVSASGFGGGLSSYTDITSEQFAYGSSATSSTQRFLYDTTTGYLRFDVDGSGSAASTVLAILQGAPTFTNSDIYVF